MSATANLYSAWHYKVYSSFGSDIDLKADGPTIGSQSNLSRRFTLLSSGTLVVKRGDSAATTVTITGLVAGQVLDIQAATIVSAGTTITSVLVHW